MKNKMSFESNAPAQSPSVLEGRSIRTPSRRMRFDSEQAGFPGRSPATAQSGFPASQSGDTATFLEPGARSAASARGRSPPLGSTLNAERTPYGRGRTEQVPVSEPMGAEIVEKSGWGFDLSPTVTIWLVLIPLIVWLFLFTWRPSFVSDQVNGQKTINTARLIFYTMLITIFIYVAMYVAYMVWPMA